MIALITKAFLIVAMAAGITFTAFSPPIAGPSLALTGRIYHSFCRLLLYKNLLTDEIPELFECLMN